MGPTGAMCFGVRRVTGFAAQEAMEDSGEHRGSKPALGPEGIRSGWPGKVAWALCACPGDFFAAAGEAVSAGLGTDCNGAMVGGLRELSGAAIPAHRTTPWHGRIAIRLAGSSEPRLDDLVQRAVAVAECIA